MRSLAWILLAVLAASCAPQKTSTVRATAAGDDLPLKEVMAHVVDPAGFDFWSGAGSRIRADGVHYVSPRNDEEWKRVENGATSLVEMSSRLRLPDREREPRSEWEGYVDRLKATATAGKAAAEHHDKAAVAALGDQLYDVCEGCHERYLPKVVFGPPAKPPQSATPPAP